MKIAKTVCSLALGVIALGVVGCASPAQMDFASDKALIDMSVKLATANQLSFTATRKLDRQLIENPAIIGRANIDAKVRRPDRAKAVVTGEGKSRTFYLRKEGSVIHDGRSGHFARMPGKPTIDESLDAASKYFDVHIPIQDFLSNNPYHGFRMGSDRIDHAGVSTIGGHPCDVLNGSREDLTWQLFIGVDDNLPRRFVVNVAGLKGKDHLVIDFKTWDLTTKHPTGSLEFTPGPKDSEIQFLPPGEAAAQ